MNDLSAKMIEQFEVNPWFTNCGVDLSDSPTRLRVNSWSEAVKLCKSRFHENVQTESRNLLTQHLFVHARVRFRDTWNVLARELNPILYGIIDTKVVDMAKTRNFKISAAVRVYLFVDLLCCCMELEYADLLAPKYFAERAKWYLAGHFPCGWDGQFPEGRLLVF
ncbi:MAG: hypothetical protein WCL32_09950 [Planctomycetota bacterium]